MLAYSFLYGVTCQLAQLPEGMAAACAVSNTFLQAGAEGRVMQDHEGRKAQRRKKPTPRRYESFSHPECLHLQPWQGGSKKKKTLW